MTRLSDLCPTVVGQIAANHGRGAVLVIVVAVLAAIGAIWIVGRLDP